MKKLNLSEVSQYVEKNIGTFHTKRIQSLDCLKLVNVLKRKNPYLFKAKYVLTADQIVRGIIDAQISSNEETIFGNWLEGLAIFINGKVFGGRKSGITNIVGRNFGSLFLATQIFILNLSNHLDIKQRKVMTTL